MKKTLIVMVLGALLGGCDAGGLLVVERQGCGGGGAGGEGCGGRDGEAVCGPDRADAGSACDAGGAAGAGGQ